MTQIHKVYHVELSKPIEVDSKLEAFLLWLTSCHLRDFLCGTDRNKLRLSKVKISPRGKAVQQR